MVVPSTIGKWSYVTSVRLKNPKTSRTKFLRQSPNVINLILARTRPLKSSHDCFFKYDSPLFGNFFHYLRQKSDRNVLNTAFTRQRVSNDCNQEENGDLTWLKQEQGPNLHQLLSCAIVKRWFVPTVGLKKRNISRRKLFRRLFVKYIEKISEVKIKL